MTTKYNRITNKGTYNCDLCGKLTRDTGHGEASVNNGYCKTCLLWCYMDNSLNDYGPDSDEYKNAKSDYEESKAKDERCDYDRALRAKRTLNVAEMIKLENAGGFLTQPYAGGVEGILALRKLLATDVASVTLFRKFEHHQATMFDLMSEIAKHQDPK